MDYTEENARSILCQAMLDETIRLRNCYSRKERDSIRKFLTEAYLSIQKSNCLLNPISDQEIQKQIQDQKKKIELLKEAVITGVENGYVSCKFKKNTERRERDGAS